MRAAATAWGDVLQVRKREDNELLWARASANVARAVSDLFHYLLMEDGGEITERVREVASNAATMAVRDVVAEVSDPASAASAKPSLTAAAVNAARLNKRRRSRLNSTDIDPAAWLVHSVNTVAPRVCAERAR